MWLLTLAWCGAAAAAERFCEFEVERTATEPTAVAEAVVFPFGITSAVPSLTVTTLTGQPVAHQIVWQAPGDPWLVRFDATAGSRWRIRFEDGGRSATGTPWVARAGVVLETRALPEGTFATLSDFQKQWTRGAGNVLARATVDRIFHGFNPLGLDQPLMARYDGWLRIPAAGRYRLALVADDAAFLLLDERPIVEWGGWHDLKGGERGEHAADVDLPAGTVHVTLLNAQKDAAFMAGLYWQPPGSKKVEPVPADAFAPAAATRILRATAASPDVAAAGFGWEPVDHFLAGEACWVRTRCWILNPQDGVTYAWRFDDGGEAAGSEVSHLFFTAGDREVTVQASRGGESVGRLHRRIRVRPNGLQRHELDHAAFDALRPALRERNLDRLPISDLTQAILLADTVRDIELLTAFGEAAVRRLPEFKSDHWRAVYQLGFHFQHPTLRRYAVVEQLWRGLLASRDAPAPLAARTRLHLAGMLIHTGRGIGEGVRLLQACDRARLDSVEQRLHTIFRGDAAAAAGDRPEALRLYREAGGTAAETDTAFEVRRAERLERARGYLKAGELDAAEKVLRELEWERPIVRAGLETGLLLTEVFHQRGEMAIAVTMCRRLGAVAPAGPRQAELLQKTVEICSALSLNDEADAARMRLEAEFPYSEAAAMVHARPPLVDDAELTEQK